MAAVKVSVGPAATNTRAGDSTILNPRDPTGKKKLVNFNRKAEHDRPRVN